MKAQPSRPVGIDVPSPLIVTFATDVPIGHMAKSFIEFKGTASIVTRKATRQEFEACMEKWIANGAPVVIPPHRPHWHYREISVD